jgi:transposase-like protein
MPGGHPTDYHPDFNDLASSMFSKGKTVAAVAAACGVCRDSLYEWAKKWPEFSDTLKKGLEVAQSFWENIGENEVEDPSGKFNTTLYIFMMKARFKKDYAEFQKIEQDINVNKTPEQLADTVEALLKQKTNETKSE